MWGEAPYKDLQGCYKFLSWKKSRFREVQALSWGRELDLEVWVLSTISTSVEEHWPSLCILGFSKSHSFIGPLCLVSSVWAWESCKCIFYKSNPIFSVLREHTIYSSESFDEVRAFFFFFNFNNICLIYMLSRQEVLYILFFLKWSLASICPAFDPDSL